MTSKPPQKVYAHVLVASSDTEFLCITGVYYWQHKYRDVLSYDIITENWTPEESVPYDLRLPNCVKTVFRLKDVILCLFGQYTEYV